MRSCGADSGDLLYELLKLSGEDGPLRVFAASHDVPDNDPDPTIPAPYDLKQIVCCGVHKDIDAKHSRNPEQINQPISSQPLPSTYSPTSAPFSSGFNLLTLLY